MIIICLGNPGSGKTASVVRDIVRSEHSSFYSNIVMKKTKNNTIIKPEMIVKREIVGTKKKRSGEEEPIYESKLNVEFWQNAKGNINVVIDEAHSIINSRRSMSKTNVIMSDWMALIRRVLGQSDGIEGNLYLITQLPNRLDVIARDMCRQVRWHRCHFTKECKKCEFAWREHSDHPDQAILCPKCDFHNLKKKDFSIEVKYFSSINEYEQSLYGMSSPYKHFIINDIEKYFPYYNTLQWENMFSELY